MSGNCSCLLIPTECLTSQRFFSSQNKYTIAKRYSGYNKGLFASTMKMISGMDSGQLPHFQEDGYRNEAEFSESYLAFYVSPGWMGRMSSPHSPKSSKNELTSKPE